MSHHLYPEEIPTLRIPDSFEPGDWESSASEVTVVDTPSTSRFAKMLDQIHSSAPAMPTYLVDAILITLAAVGAGIHFPAGVAASVVVMLMTFYIGHVYDERDPIQAKGVLWYAAKLVVPVGAVILMGMLLHAYTNHEAGYFALFIGLLLGISRIITWLTLHTMRARGRAVRRTLIIGSGSAVETAANKLRQFRSLGLVPIGALRLRDILGDDSLAAVIRVTGAEHVILAPELGEESSLVESIRRCSGVEATFSLLPPLADLFLHPASINEVGGLPLVPLGRLLRRRLKYPGKRAVDLFGATVGLVLLAPVFLGIAIAIKLDSPGPDFFRQNRVGRDGVDFGVFKFRSMVVGADKEFDELRKSSANVTDGLLFKHSADHRVTRLGKLIRRTSVDELPQLINVFLGSMSLVGPRPLAVAAEEFDTLEHERHSVLPGMTGYWQVSGGNDLTYQEMVRLDLAYIRNWSLWLDLRLMIKTVPALFSRFGGPT